jgi:hypothetical protein
LQSSAHSEALYPSMRWHFWSSGAISWESNMAQSLTVLFEVFDKHRNPTCNLSEIGNQWMLQIVGYYRLMTSTDWCYLITWIEKTDRMYVAGYHWYVVLYIEGCRGRMDSV